MPDGQPMLDLRQPYGDTLLRLFEAVRQGLFIGTLRAGGDETEAANPHLKLMLGYPAETPDGEVLPFEPERFVDPMARDALIDQLGRDGAVADCLARLRRADGAAIWVEITGQAERHVDGTSLRLLALVRDVSERKRLDDQSRELYHQLLQAEKLASLGQTISGVAHELNNPLATILASAERLAQRPLEPGLKSGVDTILGEAERAAKIVRSLLTFARKRQTTRTMVDVNEVVRDTLALRQYEQRVANIAAVEALAAGLPAVFADPYQLQQVLLNLVINAEQAMISAHGRGTLILRSWQDADRDVVVVEVSDDGPGVSDEVLPKIFDPFFTTKGVGHGTGLGLTVAYAIMEEHGGRLAARSLPAGGAAFQLELPAAVSGTPAAARQTVATLAPVGAGASVLLVEDEAALAAAVADGLAEAGFRVTRAADGEEGLAQVSEGTFDLVICDLRMPRVDGPTFYRAIAATSPALARRVIFVTGDVAGTEAAQFLDETRCRWLAKPFRLSDLLRLAREVLA